MAYIQAARVSPPDPRDYDFVLLCSSGGKDGLAALGTLLDAGFERSQIELHHHLVDGHDGPPFMDWPSGEGYCEAVARALDLPIYFSWRDGGFRREMMRRDAPTAPVFFQTPGGGVETAGGKGPTNTRLRFPQVTADLSTRWCSAYCKIMILEALIRNQDRFLGARTLVVTGERAEESPSRAKYPVFEAHRSDTRAGTRKRRHVDHWRPVHGHTEAQVWDVVRRLGIVPAPSYRLGWGRHSCMACIFLTPDAWSTLRLIAPAMFADLAAHERLFGCTIRRTVSIVDLADRGTPYRAAVEQPELARKAVLRGWDEPVTVAPSAWTLPAGAYGESTGPT